MVCLQNQSGVMTKVWEQKNNNDWTLLSEWIWTKRYFLV